MAAVLQEAQEDVRVDVCAVAAHAPLPHRGVPRPGSRPSHDLQRAPWPGHSPHHAEPGTAGCRVNRGPARLCRGSGGAGQRGRRVLCPRSGAAALTAVATATEEQGQAGAAGDGEEAGGAGGQGKFGPPSGS